MTPDSPIAVFDSGLGGLTVAAEIHRVLPDEQLVFLADRARVPYASLSPVLITKFASECADFLLKREPKALVIACNTVSAVALDEIRERTTVPVFGVVKPTALAAVKATRSRRIGVLATTATVKRRAYETAISELLPDAMVYSNGCPLFVPLVEEGWTKGEIPKKIVEHYAEPIRQSDVDTVVLGCTHYEYFRKELQEVFGDSVSLINTPKVAAEELAAGLRKSSQLRRAESAGKVEICSTDVTDALERVVADLFPTAESGSVTIRAVQVPPQESTSRRRGELSLL